MQQLDLFTRKPSLELGKAYRLYFGYKSEHYKDVYIGNVEYRGDPWDPYCHIVYFVTCENTLPSMQNSTHDCGYYMHEDRKLWAQYQTLCTKFYELKDSDLIQFISKLRSKCITDKFGLSRHPSWDRLLST